MKLRKTFSHENEFLKLVQSEKEMRGQNINQITGKISVEKCGQIIQQNSICHRVDWANGPKIKYAPGSTF